MADIEITCASCTKHFSISQYAKTAGINCPHCGATLPGDEDTETTEMQPTEKTELRLAGKAELEPLFEEPVHPDDVPKKGRKKKDGRSPLSVFRMNKDGVLDMNKRHERKKTSTDKRESLLKSTLFSWLLFLILGGLMFFVRYGLEGDPHALFAGLIPYSWMVLACLHVVVTISAATSDVFQGILCALIPGYSLLYIFWQSDNFYLRAATAAALIGFGQDGGLQILDWSASQMNAISAWIESGGGDIRPD